MGYKLVNTFPSIVKGNFNQIGYKLYYAYYIGRLICLQITTVDQIFTQLMKNKSSFTLHILLTLNIVKIKCVWQFR